MGFLSLPIHALEAWAETQRTRESSKPDAEWEKGYRKAVMEGAQARVRARTNPIAWTCFDKHILSGARAEDVASQLKLTANRVYVYAHRVKVQLRKEYEKYKLELEAK
jgi:hypothetical protein